MSRNLEQLLTERDLRERDLVPITIERYPFEKGDGTQPINIRKGDDEWLIQKEVRAIGDATVTLISASLPGQSKEFRQIRIESNLAETTLTKAAPRYSPSESGTIISRNEQSLRAFNVESNNKNQSAGEAGQTFFSDGRQQAVNIVAGLPAPQIIQLSHPSLNVNAVVGLLNNLNMTNSGAAEPMRQSPQLRFEVGSSVDARNLQSQALETIFSLQRAVSTLSKNESYLTAPEKSAPQRTEQTNPVEMEIATALRPADKSDTRVGLSTQTRPVSAQGRGGETEYGYVSGSVGLQGTQKEASPFNGPYEIGQQTVNAVIDSAKDIHEHATSHEKHLNDTFGWSKSDSPTVEHMKSDTRHQSFSMSVRDKISHEGQQLGLNRAVAEYAASGILTGWSVGIEAFEIASRTLNRATIDPQSKQRVFSLDLISKSLGAIPERVAAGIADIVSYWKGIVNYSNIAAFEAQRQGAIANQIAFEMRTQAIAFEYERTMSRMESLASGLMQGPSERQYSLGVEGISQSEPSGGEYSLGIDYEGMFSGGESTDKAKGVEGGANDVGTGVDSTESNRESEKSSGSSGSSDAGGRDRDHGSAGQSGGNQGGGEQSSGGSCNTGKDPGSPGGQCTPGGSTGGSNGGGNTGGEGNEGGGKEGGGGGEGGGCFLTTACLEALEIDEAESQLAELRLFRDSYLRWICGGTDLISEYYRIAPALVHHIDKRSDSKKFYEYIFHHLVKPTLALIRKNQPDEAVKTYREFVVRLTESVLPEVAESIRQD